jgi:uncharacterized LabA/DUF88 family protein
MQSYHLYKQHPNSLKMKKKLNLYIDGFNLYFGLRTYRREYKWLDLMAVGRLLCKPDEKLGEVYYFTANLVGPDKAKLRRQKIYIEALKETGVKVVFGKYLKKPVYCKSCKVTSTTYEEKESDVNLATQIMLDACAGNGHTFAVISADSDLILPMLEAKATYGRNVLPVFPPKRHSKEIKARIGKHYALGEALLKKCQLPNAITKADGYTLQRPKKWS